MTIKQIRNMLFDYGIKSKAYAMPLSYLDKQITEGNISVPLIIHLSTMHYVVIYKIAKESYSLMDPAAGAYSVSRAELLSLLDPTVDDPQCKVICIHPKLTKDDKIAINQKITLVESQYAQNTVGFNQFLRISIKSILDERRSFKLILVNILVITISGLSIPIAFQIFIDAALPTKEIAAISGVLLASGFLFVSIAMSKISQGLILLHIGGRVHQKLMNDFLWKLTNKPMSFFEDKVIGDLYQHSEDQHRIERFLTRDIFNLIQNIVLFVVNLFVLYMYSSAILLIIIISSLLYLIYIYSLMSRRRTADEISFSAKSKESSSLFEFFHGIADIKIYNSTRKRLDIWNSFRVNSFFKEKITFLLSQYQIVGGSILLKFMELIVLGYASLLIINDYITIGMLITIVFILNQLTGPLKSIGLFSQTAQDALISLNRTASLSTQDVSQNEIQVPKLKYPTLKVCEAYYGFTESLYALENVSFEVAFGQQVAIVGPSGSGKSTLLKLLLNFYEPNKGHVYYDNYISSEVNHNSLLANISYVSQHPYIFDDTIANNITECDHEADQVKLKNVLESAAATFIYEYPAGLQTKVGQSGRQLSGGEAQRVVLARALYKRSPFLFLDEPTNALDSISEEIIIDAISSLRGIRTVIMVAHRLSTIKKADKIIVLDSGRIVGIGTHESLKSMCKEYITLAKKQTH